MSNSNTKINIKEIGTEIGDFVDLKKYFEIIAEIMVDVVCQKNYVIIWKGTSTNCLVRLLQNNFSFMQISNLEINYFIFLRWTSFSRKL